MDMTDKEALREARRRWGKKAVVIHRREWLPAWATPYAVGIRKGWGEAEVLGHGMSWEQAFAAVERCPQSSQG
ncbi:MAG TPA: hypothetical protein VGY58_00540 [Gemmataceae bacterium]|nr:hypothetical protein [Gemmataceae bacterium]